MNVCASSLAYRLGTFMIEICPRESIQQKSLPSTDIHDRCGPFAALLYWLAMSSSRYHHRDSMEESRALSVIRFT